MSKSNFIPLDREQFKLLGEAKRLIAKEFNQQLALQSSDLINEIGRYSQKSESSRLLNIFKQLQLSPSENCETANKKTAKKRKPSGQKVVKNAIKVGDIVKGQTCTGFYRGQPVFK